MAQHLGQVFPRLVVGAIPIFKSNLSAIPALPYLLSEPSKQNRLGQWSLGVEKTRTEEEALIQHWLSLFGYVGMHQNLEPM